MKKRTGTILLLIVTAAIIGLAIWCFAATRRSPADGFLTTFYNLDGTDEGLGRLMDDPFTEESSEALITALYGPLSDAASEELLTTMISQRVRLDLAQWAVSNGYALTPGKPTLNAVQTSAGQSISFSLAVTISDGSKTITSIQQTGEIQTDGNGYVTYFRPSDLGYLLTWTQ